MEFTDSDLDLAELYIKRGNDEQRTYWINRLNKRIEFITPLIHELALKGIHLIQLSKELNHEYNTLHMIKIKHQL